MGKDILRWGICSAGRICNDYVLCLNSLPANEHKVVAVAARDEERAKAFASTHSIPTYYDSYKELANDSNIDIVYIGSIHTEHYALSMMMLEAGKHVLCEKPLCVTLAQTKKLFEVAKQRKLFLMEGIWSRCFPAYKKVRELIKAGEIGEVMHVQAQFGEYCPSLNARMIGKETAGGALLDRGIYAIQFVQFVFNERPLEQSANGSLLKETGVDTSCHIFLRYSNNKTALVSTSVLANLPNEGIISGTKGTIKVCFPFWCPNRIEVCQKYGKTESIDFDLPPKPTGGKLNFRNSEGFQYEAQEVRRCILEGLTDCPLLTSQMSIDIAEIIERARHEIGYDLPQDKDVL